MLQSFRVSADGIHTTTMFKGQTYDLPQELANSLVRDKLALPYTEKKEYTDSEKKEYSDGVLKTEETKPEAKTEEVVKQPQPVTSSTGAGQPKFIPQQWSRHNNPKIKR